MQSYAWGTDEFLKIPTGDIFNDVTNFRDNFITHDHMQKNVTAECDVFIFYVIKYNLADMYFFILILKTLIK